MSSVPELKEISSNLVVLSDIQSKIRQYFIYSDIKLRKVANTCIFEYLLDESDHCHRSTILSCHLQDQEETNLWLTRKDISPDSSGEKTFYSP